VHKIALEALQPGSASGDFAHAVGPWDQFIPRSDPRSRPDHHPSPPAALAAGEMAGSRL